MSPSSASLAALVVLSCGVFGKQHDNVPLIHNALRTNVGEAEASATRVMSLAEEYQRALGLDDYGNWCGPGHGGYQDCCNGGRCSACTGTGPPSAACLSQCPPIDEMDVACSKHDTCCFDNPGGIFCIPQGNLCACDCLLLEAVAQARCGTATCQIYKSALTVLFADTLSCWYKEKDGHHECNAVGFWGPGDYTRYDYCNNGHACDPWNPNC